MKIDHSKYMDKLYACWIGKNIGGTMGTPYEGKREVLDVKGFVTKENEVLPNDDLDLQLVWLLALERIGPAAISAATLGEFWLSFITPDWNEYGVNKANMRRGLVPPLSGDYSNSWRDSNGAWIRTEIWASVAPGFPDLAARYAIEDAKVDHGAGEGTMAAAFVATLQSAAYVVNDLRKCIDIALAALPEGTRVAKTVRFVLDSYDSGKSWLECRNAIQKLNSDIGDGWFEAPSNIGYTVLGLVYGEGDFKRSMLTAINCGDDTDCTAATVGATLGILYGTAGIPEDWKKHIGDDIVTISVSKGYDGRFVPKTCTDLAERVAVIAPSVLALENKSMFNVWGGVTNIEVTLSDVEDIPANIDRIFEARTAAVTAPALASLRPYSMHFENIFMDADVSLTTPEISPNGEVGVHLKLKHSRKCENQPYGISLRWLLPEGFTAEGRRSVYLPPYDSHQFGEASLDYVIRAGERIESENRVVLEITIPGRPTPLYVSFILLG